MTRRRVVVTGMGIVSPVGIGLAAAWDSIRNARSGVGPITRFDASTFPTRIAGRGQGLRRRRSTCRRRKRGATTRSSTTASSATMDAVADAGLDDYAGDKERVGVCIGSGIGGLPLIEETKAAYMRRRLAQDHAVLRAGLDHQHGRGPRVDPLRLPGPEPRDRQRVLDGEPQHRRGGAADRVRRRRRDDRRRHRSRRSARSASAASAPRARCRRATTIRRRRAGRGTSTATASCWARAPASWCSRSTSTRRRAARASTASSPATG